ncbi:diaminopimelate epimerase [Novosphingobium fuchskuhlense]|uniref:Diaminopimelate epimerase n=1 Tax=Novosphingobium fuchskuhlense TaxID=1117702 RepID=A0A124JUU9_9SPHN|nr:diaminopimelate epimerase [Novosphingobium fuchskuhlense]KUR71614.1 diaminopimelate epimerase [Novosphingobium fuchskuhlense]
MSVAFRKMHGLGNDFIVIDARPLSGNGPVAMSAARAAALAERRTGIGCDQLIVLEPSTEADVRMRIFNADGSEVEACGNATRAVGMLLGGAQRIETLGGMLASTATAGGASVDMGPARFGWDEIPLAYAMDTLHMPVGWEELENPAAVNVGNPHVVFFVPDADAVDLARLGPVIETDPLFPEKVNVGVASVTGPSHLRLSVWERGVGLTRACGTGACAAAVLALRRRLVTGPVRVELPGGPLEIAWEPGGTILMTGPAAFSFAGTFDEDDYPL